MIYNILYFYVGINECENLSKMFYDSTDEIETEESE